MLGDAAEKADMVIRFCPDFEKKEASDIDKVKELQQELEAHHKKAKEQLDLCKRGAQEAWIFMKKSSTSNVPQPINHTGPRGITFVHTKARHHKE